jgi:pSer/pThr/pTyr-binding forkhead associated (FHA) protein
LIISDISVSRLHATIKLLNNKFVIFDNNSKFGTLVLLKDSFPITNEKIAVQVGRTVITFVKKLDNPSTSAAKPEENHKKNFNTLNFMNDGELPKAPVACAPGKSMKRKQGEESEDEDFNNFKFDE